MTGLLTVAECVEDDSAVITAHRQIRNCLLIRLRGLWAVKGYEDSTLYCEIVSLHGKKQNYLTSSYPSLHNKMVKKIYTIFTYQMFKENLYYIYISYGQVEKNYI